MGILILYIDESYTIPYALSLHVIPSASSIQYITGSFSLERILYILDSFFFLKILPIQREVPNFVNVFHSKPFPTIVSTIPLI